jgi:hypothetical protein
MIFTDDASLVTLGDIEIGTLALSFAYGHNGAACLIADAADAGAKLLVRLQSPFYTTYEDHRTVLLSLGVPKIRFDPASAVSDERRRLESGTLVITQDGPGIYQSSNGGGVVAGHAVLLSGERRQFYRAREIPAFARWEIGYDREEEFVPIAMIELDNDNTSGG